MASRGMLSIEHDPVSRSRLRQAIRNWPQDFQTAFRRRLGEVAEEDVVEHVLERVPRVLRRGVRVDVLPAKGPGIRVRLRGASLTASQAEFLVAYNKPSFRHPTYGHTDREVTQKGRPYFGDVVGQQSALEAAAEAAVNDLSAAFEAQLAPLPKGSPVSLSGFRR